MQPSRPTFACSARSAARALVLTLCALGQLAAPAPALHSPHDVIEAWAISPNFAADRTLFISVPRFTLLLRSRDGGESWQTINSGLPAGYVQFLTVSPGFARDRTLWCTDLGALYVSRDGGDHWQPVPTPPDMKEVVTLAVEPDFPGNSNLVAGTRRAGQWASYDRGETWQRLELPAAGGVVKYDWLREGLLVAITDTSQVLVALDGGEKFESIPAPKDTVLQAVEVHQNAGRGAPLWFALKDRGVWRTDHHGFGWVQDGTGTEGANVLHLSQAQEADGTPVLFASTAQHGLLVRGRDGNWSARHDGFRTPSNQTKEHHLGTMPSPSFAQDRTVYACTFEGLHVSTDGGTTWRWLNVLHPRLVRNVALSPDFARDGCLWLSTYGSGLLQSCDRGENFTRLDTLDWDFPDGIAVAPSAAGERALLIGTPNRFLIGSDAGTAPKVTLAGKGFARVLGFAPDWQTSGRAFAHIASDAGLPKNRFVFTTDRGGAWTDTNIRTVWDMAFASDWSQSGVLWVATPTGVMRSEDRGCTFEPVQSFGTDAANSVALAPGLPGEPDIVMAAARASGAYLSRDGGLTWERRMGGMDGLRIQMLRLSPDFASDGLAFAGPPNGTVHVTHDGGLHWKPVSGGPRLVVWLEISPTFREDRTLLVGSYDGAWISENAGDHWRLLDVPMPESDGPIYSREPGEGPRPGDAQR
ncbi:MAG: WD40/YVTN/BNR-like repeat-containing protein [Planctomycetota bacterium]